MKAFITDLEGEMGHANPAGLELMEQELHPTPLSTLKDTVLDVLHNEFSSNNTVLAWNSSAGDRAMLAAFKDLIERMGEVAKRKIVWQPAKKDMPLPWAVSATLHEKQTPLSTGIIPMKISSDSGKGGSSDVACVVISETVRGRLTPSIPMRVARPFIFVGWLHELAGVLLQRERARCRNRSWSRPPGPPWRRRRIPGNDSGC
eukprot:1718385-Prymnesium_polylepis.1